MLGLRSGDVVELQKTLSEDISFFFSYKDKFRDNLLITLDKDRSKLIGVPGLNTLVDRLYLLLFSFRRDPTEELFNISYFLARNEIDLKGAIGKSFMALLKDYIDFLIQKEQSYKKVKLLISLIDAYLSIIEDAYLKYVEELRKEIKAKEKSVSESEQKIAMGFLKKVKNQEVKIITYYKGMTVTCGSQVLSVRGELAEVDICSMDILSLGREIYISHPNLPKVIATEVVEEGRIKGKAILKVKGFKDLPRERRRYLRVVPKDPIKVKIYNRGKEVVGTLADVSVGGVGVYIRNPLNLKEGKTVDLEVPLPNGMLESKAQVIYLLPYKESFRVGFEYHLDLQVEEMVSDFVMARQFEILRELKHG